MKKNSWYWIIGIIIAILVLRSCDEKSFTGFDLGVDTGGNGGGGGGGGDDGDGTVPPDGFDCDDCDAMFLEGNPGIVMDGFTNIFQRPWKAFAKGHWNCVGKCIYNGIDVSDKYNCVLDPTDEIPEGGYDSPLGEKPDCVCLPKLPGECNFYDANYGEGIDNIICGGSCPVGSSCAYWIFQGKEHCDCMQAENKCGFHLSESIRMDHNFDELESSCYGWCDSSEGEGCQFWIDEKERPHCDCEGPYEDKDSCSNIDVVADDGTIEWWKCWTLGQCSNTIESCQFDQASQKCACIPGNTCDWHLTSQQAQELYNRFGGDFAAAVDYILANWNLYCYGQDCSTDKTCSIRQVDIGSRTIWDCGCYPSVTPDFDLLASQLPIGSQLPLIGGILIR